MFRSGLGNGPTNNSSGVQVMAIEGASSTDEEDQLDLETYDILEGEEEVHDHDLLDDEVSDDDIDGGFNQGNIIMQDVDTHNEIKNCYSNDQDREMSLQGAQDRAGVDPTGAGTTTGSTETASTATAPDALDGAENGNPRSRLDDHMSRSHVQPMQLQQGQQHSQPYSQDQRQIQQNGTGFYNANNPTNNGEETAMDTSNGAETGNVGNAPNQQVLAQPQDPAQQGQSRHESTGNREEEQDEPYLDGYERNDLIGQGAYGIVYRGTQRSTGKIVAIKRIPFADSTTEGGVPCSVIREISLLRELDHVNVVRLLDVIQARPGGLYLVFEYVAHDLKTFMDQHQTSDDPAERKGLPVPMVKSFMTQMLSGVAFCHTYRVLHRDLKPHNLLISADGTQLKLADFGLARLSGLPNGPYTHEVVTLWYRAPELLLGTNRYSASVDVWSVGCIFAEMATGTPLFPGRSDIDQLFKIFQRRGTPNSEIWPIVSRLPHYNAEFPRWPVRPITDFVPLDALGSNAAADLLNQVLQYDPDRRIACRTALQHPYIRS